MGVTNKVKIESLILKRYSESGFFCRSGGIVEIKIQGYPALETGDTLLFSPFLPSYSEVPFWYHTVLI